MKNTISRSDPHNEIDQIFRKILPAHGMAVREAQIELSHNMYEAMKNGSIALADAGTGIGKTYSYLTAGFVFNKYDTKEMSVLVSTSSIALQKAIVEEYIPFLSSALIEAGLTDSPILAVVRKGKSHYVCDKRLVRRLGNANLQKKNESQRRALLSLRTTLDMDQIEHLSSFDRQEVCVESCCGCDKTCRYRDFIRQSRSPEYTFQICNHNFLLADAMHRDDAITPLLPDYSVAVIDEAHKLPDAARQMFSVTLSQSEMRAAFMGLYREQYTLAYSSLKKTLIPIMADLDAVEYEEDSENADYKMWSERKMLFMAAEKALTSICRVLDGEISDTLMRQLESILKLFSLFKAGSQTYISYASVLDDGKTGLCATAANIDRELERILWKNGIPMILTSGTLAVGSDFSRFKEETGLANSQRHIVESVSLSPFDYERNCMLYIPMDTVSPDEENASEYLDTIADRIESLLRTTHGRTLVLFTSYSTLAEIHYRLKNRNLPYPLFNAKRNAAHIIEDFKASENGVLLGTGALWEGVDFPGDIVSQIILPRLPFAVPDPVSEKKRERYISLQDFIKHVILPDMQIKLRQGFGRAIRTETDTCLISVLDDRARRGHRYHNAVRRALPDMNVTSSLNTASRFIHSVKPDSYFSEVE